MQRLPDSDGRTRLSTAQSAPAGSNLNENARLGESTRCQFLGRLQPGNQVIRRFEETVSCPVRFGSTVIAGA